MAINPLQLPTWHDAPKVDFSPLDKIGDAFVKNRQDQAEAQAFSGLVDSIAQKPGQQPATGAPAGAPAPGRQMPRSWRNNNPGNIEDGPLAKSIPGYKGPDESGRYATFESPEHGMTAVDALLTSYGRRGHKTYLDVTSRWAPKSEKDPNNDPEAYAKFISPNGDPNAPVDLSNAEERKRLTGRIGLWEAGLPGMAPNAGAAQGQATPGSPRGMPPEMADRVKSLFASGSPKARELGIALLGKYIGKQEPIKIGAEDALIDPETFRTLATGQGKPTAVREGGALVQNGKEVYRSPDKPQNVAPGGSLVQGGKAVFQSPANLHLQEVELEDGTKVPVVFDPRTGAVRKPTQQELATTQNGDLPPEVSPKIVRKERSEALVTNEQAAVNSAKAAGDLKPLIDAAAVAYQRAIKAGAVGQTVGSPAVRAGAKYLWGGEAETARQDYDKAIAAVQARITAAQNKGQGAVSDYERKMYGMQFPDLQAADPKDQIKFLNQLQETTNQTIEAGRSPMLGKQPTVPLDRPPVREPPKPPKVDGKQSAAPVATKMQLDAAKRDPQGAIDAAKAGIAAGKDRAAVIRQLQALKVPVPPDL